MKLNHSIKYLAGLVALAGLPAVGQLIHDGFAPPTHIPFGITVEDIQRLPTHIVWVDARPDDMFRSAHIPGALNLNRSNWDQALPQLFAAYQPGNSIVVYCSPDCTESEEIAAKIRDLGFDQPLVLEGGFESWQKEHPGL